MSKVKKRNYDKQTRSKDEIMTKETQFALIGILFFLVCIIGMINNGGQVGFIIRYIFVYLTGYFNIFFLVGGSAYGVLLFIKRRHPKVKINLMFGAAISLFVFTLISSSANQFTLSEVVSKYNSIFNANVSTSYLSSQLGGGFIGFFIYSFLQQFIGEVGVKIICGVFIVASIFVLLKTPLFLAVDYLNKKSSKKVASKKKEAAKKEAKRFYNDEEAIRQLQKFQVKDEVMPLARSQIVNEPFVEQLPRAKQEEEFDVFTGRYNFIANQEKKEEIVVPKKVSDSTTFDVFSTPIINTSPRVQEAPIVIMEEPNVQNKEEKIVEEPQIIVKQPTMEAFAEEMIGQKIETQNFESNEQLKKESPIFVNPRQNEIPSAPYIVEKKEVLETKVRVVAKYQMPDTTLLNEIKPMENYHNQAQAKEKFALLQSKLDSFGIKANVIDYVISPAFTRFIIAVDESVKLTVFRAISNDLQLSLSAVSVNVLAPIPGSNFVGVEIPNVTRGIISFKETIIESIGKPLLYVPLGKDVAGKVVGIDITRSPHILVAGSTNTGKSVCLNTIITSIIFRTKPSDVRLIIIDPKRVELGVFGAVPHMACPVITDNKIALLTLKRLIDFMNDRYDLLSGAHHRNIQTYNEMLVSQGKPPLDYYVVIIDEFADLTMKNKDAEESIQRLTQLARAAGIHLIVATQRPSTDVITGVIKNNISTRIAFAVPSNVDSRTILDSNGAENLLGKGDMLLVTPGELSLIRAQGTFVQEDETKRIIDFTAKFGGPIYNPYFLDLDVQEELPLDLELNNGDEELKSNICDLIKLEGGVTTNKVSAKLRIGFNRATRILDEMYQDGLICRDNTDKFWEINS